MEKKKNSFTSSTAETLPDCGSFVSHIEAVPKAFVWKDEAGLVTKLLSEAAGGERLCVRTDIVPPGLCSAKYHSHSRQEEFFFILEGNGILRLSGREYSVEKGSYVSKPAGKQNPHTFFNSGPGPLLILDIATVEPEDTCYYPSLSFYLQKTEGQRRIFEGGHFLTDWNSDPNGSV